MWRTQPLYVTDPGWDGTADMTPEDLAKQVLEEVRFALEGGYLDAYQVYAIARILFDSERVRGQRGVDELVSRDLQTVDCELRMAADTRRTCREHDWPMPSSARANELLDERRALSVPPA
jgi:hypothetical protein